MALLRLENINKWVGKEQILKGVSVKIEEGQFLAIVGPSGSGKSSLLYILGLLDRPTSGSIYYREKVLDLSQTEFISKLRNESLGFVFQFHYLIPELNVVENVMAPQIKRGVNHKEARDKAMMLLERLGLKGKEKRQIFEISGGEMQRVAIARAMANDPEILLCDEPTGNLDSKNTHTVMEIFKEINRKGTTIVMVTHDLNLAKMTKGVLEMLDGEIISYTSLETEK
ncbi:MAG: ABC transporter ATP-binding protein [Caldimicrobium sp.]|nr:ABC transporter ATP-binding protein [Caldimicrobium sp.]MCX7612646.1 ABC transporter ATP-binding protein [Caldimicrobium sp.]MDW8182201.1 ABC transporter ATP-binding protein [Caldimicrobium sp.]